MAMIQKVVNKAEKGRITDEETVHGESYLRIYYFVMVCATQTATFLKSMTLGRRLTGLWTPRNESSERYARWIEIWEPAKMELG
jgi:hypothetical protein